MSVWTRDPETLRAQVLPVVQVLLVVGALIKSSRLFKADVSNIPRIARAIFRMHFLEALIHLSAAVTLKDRFHAALLVWTMGRLRQRSLAELRVVPFLEMVILGVSLWRYVPALSPVFITGVACFLFLKAAKFLP